MFCLKHWDKALLSWQIEISRPSANSREMRGERGEDEVDDEAAAMNIEAEGPTLLSTTRVNRTFVFQQLRQTVEQLRGVGAIR